MKASKRDFLRLSDLSLAEHTRLLARARELKRRRRERQADQTLAGRTVVLIFEKPSTRTRVSFEAAVTQLGGSAIALSVKDTQMGRGEPLVDTARVLSGYSDAIVMRTFGQERLEELARAATVPVMNGLTDTGHPVQLLADLMTVEERLGRISGQSVAWIGDGAGNMARSWVEAAKLFDFQLRIAAPPGHRLTGSELAGVQRWVTSCETPEQAARGADVVSTDVWASMGQEAEASSRQEVFKGYTVDAALMAQAAPHAIVLHCLPVHRGEELTEDVLEGPQSAVFDEAENRLHTQKALLEILLLG